MPVSFHSYALIMWKLVLSAYLGIFSYFFLLSFEQFEFKMGLIRISFPVFRWWSMMWHTIVVKRWIRELLERNWQWLNCVTVQEIQKVLSPLRVAKIQHRSHLFEETMNVFERHILSGCKKLDFWNQCV